MGRWAISGADAASPTNGIGHRVEETTAVDAARRRRRGRGSAVQCGLSRSVSDLDKLPNMCLLAVPPVSKQWLDEDSAHSSAINGQWTVKTANAGYEHL